MNILINAIINYFHAVIQGGKILFDYFTSPEGIDYVINGGGWLEFLKGFLRGVNGISHYIIFK